MKAFRQACHTLLVSSHRHQHNFSEMPTDYAITVHVHWTGCQIDSGCQYSVGHIQVTKDDLCYMFDNWMHTDSSQIKTVIDKNFNMPCPVLCIGFVFYL